MKNPFAAKPSAPDSAPLQVKLELWPAAFRGRATVTKDGKYRDIEISATYMPAIVNFLKLAGVI